MAVKMPILASDRGKIVENHRKQRDDALSLTSKAIAGPEYGKVRHIGSLMGTLFSTDPPLGLSWKGDFLSSGTFHDFSTIFPRFVSRNTKNHHVSQCAKNGDLSSKMVGMMRVELTTF